MQHTDLSPLVANIFFISFLSTFFQQYAQALWTSTQWKQTTELVTKGFLCTQFYLSFFVFLYNSSLFCLFFQLSFLSFFLPFFQLSFLYCFLFVLSFSFVLSISAQSVNQHAHHTTTTAQESAWKRQKWSDVIMGITKKYSTNQVASCNNRSFCQIKSINFLL